MYSTELKALEWTLALEGAAQRGGGVAIPEGAEKKTGHGTHCCALVDKVVTGLDDLGGLLKP